MSRYIFLILILGFVGGGHSKSQANSDVNILQSHVSVEHSRFYRKRLLSC